MIGQGAPAELKAALEEAEAELRALYRDRVWPLREAYAETFPPAQLPPKRNRTDKQHLVARCPRCGERLQAVPGCACSVCVRLRGGREDDPAPVPE